MRMMRDRPLAGRRQGGINGPAGVQSASAWGSWFATPSAFALDLCLRRAYRTRRSASDPGEAWRCAHWVANGHRLPRIAPVCAAKLGARRDQHTSPIGRGDWRSYVDLPSGSWGRRRFRSGSWSRRMGAQPHASLKFTKFPSMTARLTLSPSPILGDFQSTGEIDYRARDRYI